MTVCKQVRSRYGLLTAAIALVFPQLSPQAAPVTAVSVVSYSPGNASATYQNSSAALGSLNGNTGYGALNPFNPAYSPNDIVVVGQGGSLTLKLSTSIAPNGYNLGVYSNVGLSEATGGNGTATSPAANFNQPSVATVSVSQDGVNFVALNGGNPVTFSNPTNYYTDTEISGNYQTTGSLTASQNKPYLGTISNFSGSTYDQIRGTLNGSAGGTWLNVAGTVPYAVNYVRFDVAATGGNRMVVDAIGGLGATNTLTPGGRVISESVGSGANTSDVLVDYGLHSYDFQVHYSTVSITVEQALQTLQANSDFRYSIQSYSFGDLLTTVDYAGYTQTNDPNNFNLYWAEYTGDGTGNWTYGNGISSDELTNGSYAGLVWTGGNSGNPNFAIVPEPSLLGLAGFGLLLLRRRKAR